jgi:hypothetical protein
MSTRIPVTTLSNLRQNLVPPSLQDLLYIQQGSEHDRDSAISLGGLLGTQVFQSFLNDRENWRTFTIDENNSIQLGDYQRNVIIVPSAKDQSVTLDHFPSNGIIIYAPDWDSASESTAVTIGDSYGAKPIIKGGIGIFYSFGGSIISKSLICSGSDSLAELKRLIVDNIVVNSGLTLPALSILSSYIATGAVTAGKIANGAVTIDKIGNGAVTPEKIATGAVTSEKINTLAVTKDKIAADVINLILDSWTISHRWPSSGPTMNGTNFPFPRPLVPSKLRITTLTNTWSTTEELVKFELQYGSTPKTITNLTSGWSSPVNFVRYIDININENSNLIGANYINIGAKENAEGTQLDMNFTIQSIPSV